jgi:hypothetical protein
MRDLKGIVAVELLVEENGALAPAREYVHGDTTYVEGRSGQRYALRVRNLTGGRVEVVPSVDGLDVQRGQDASFDLRGLVIGPHDAFDFTGFRISHTEVATFRFGSIEQSYAAKIGKPRNVGVIGLAAFQELAPPPPPPPPPAGARHDLRGAARVAHHVDAVRPGHADARRRAGDPLRAARGAAGARDRRGRPLPARDGQPLPRGDRLRQAAAGLEGVSAARSASLRPSVACSACAWACSALVSSSLIIPWSRSMRSAEPNSSAMP